METGTNFSDYLAEQMKDPEFAAAYMQVSAQEDARLAEIRRLERVVIYAVKKWRKSIVGSKGELVNAVDALIDFESSQQRIKK